MAWAGLQNSVAMATGYLITPNCSQVNLRKSHEVGNTADASKLFIYLFIYLFITMLILHVCETTKTKFTHTRTHTHTHTHTHTEERKKPVLQGTPQQLSPITVGPHLKKYTYKRRIKSKTAFHWLCPETPYYVVFGTNWFPGSRVVLIVCFTRSWIIMFQSKALEMRSDDLESRSSEGSKFQIRTRPFKSSSAAFWKS